jgi:hypothetical protein
MLCGWGEMSGMSGLVEEDADSTLTKILRVSMS